MLALEGISTITKYDKSSCEKIDLNCTAQSVGHWVHPTNPGCFRSRGEGRNRPGLKFFGLRKQHINAPVDNEGVTTPRQVIPGETVMITRRISERRFFLRPDRNVNNIVEFCIGLAAKKHGILLHVLTVLTNQYHLEATDPHGNLPDFSFENQPGLAVPVPAVPRVKAWAKRAWQAQQGGLSHQ